MRTASRWAVAALASTALVAGPAAAPASAAPLERGSFHDDTVEATTVFPDTAAAVDAFLSAGATGLAISHSGQPAVEEAAHDALSPFVGEDGHVTLPGWFRVVKTG